MKKITLLLAMLFICFLGNAQTPLTAGDIAFLGGNSDGLSNADDNFAFVLLKDIDAATTIIFTDRGWNNVGGFFSDPGDGSFTWTSGIARSAGDIITLTWATLAPGSATFSPLGDQIFAIQGSLASPIFIAGLTFNNTGLSDDANWDGFASSNSSSARPNALTGNTAVRIIDVGGGEYDNFQFSCTLAGVNPVSGTPNDIRNILHDRTYYNGNTSTVFNPVVQAGCSVTVVVAGDTTPPVITCAPTPGPITAGIDGLAAIPDLVTGSSATDDVSIPANIVITQSPTAGTMVGVGVSMVTVTATDEAGNIASCMINVTVTEPPSTVLSAGDIAFVGFNLDGGDGFAFILLKDIIAGTNIKITDCGVNNPNTINCVGGDSTNTWYAPGAMSAGDIVSLDGTFFVSGPLASAGDQLLAFQGTMAAPVFIAAIHSNVEPGTNDADWDGAEVNNDESALPNQLINGVNAIRLHDTGTEIDNWQFDCSLVPGGSPISGTASNIASLINDIQYWINSDTMEFVPAAKGTCAYTVIISGDTTPPVISDCGPTPPDITADVLGNATMPDLTTAVVATDDVTIPANLTIVQSPVAGTSITAGVTVVTLFVTDEAGNTVTCTINVTVVNIVATTLAAGDIAFVGVNQDGADEFAFILLKDILAGTMITFTDCGVNNPNTIACVGVNDSSNIWFSPTDMPVGSIVTLDNTFLTSLSNLGDQIFAYQGPAGSPTFIAGIHTSVVGGTNDADWDGANTDGFTSALPDQLTNGVNAIRLHNTGTEVDNWQFDCTLVPGGLPVSGTPAQLAAIINDIQYWVFNDLTPFNPAAKAGCTYLPILFETEVALNGSGVLSITDVGNVSDDNITLTISGGNLRIVNTVPYFNVSGVGVVIIDANTVEVPLASITNGLFIDGVGGNDLVTLSNSLNLPGVGNGLNINNVTSFVQNDNILGGDFVSITTGGSSDIDLGNIFTFGDLTITAGGNITDSGGSALTVGGTAMFVATLDISLDNLASHTFLGPISLDGEDIFVRANADAVGNLVNFTSLTARGGSASTVVTGSGLIDVDTDIGIVSLNGNIASLTPSITVINGAEGIQQVSGTIASNLLVVTPGASQTATLNQAGNDVNLFRAGNGTVSYVDVNSVTLSGVMTLNSLSVTATTIDFASTAAITLTNGASVFNGNITASAGAVLNQNINSGSVDFTGSSINFTNLEYNGALGTTTNLNGGTTTAGNNLDFSLLNISGNYDTNSVITTVGLAFIAPSANLIGTGTISGAVTIANGATIAPGNSPGIITTGDLNLAGGSMTDFEVDGNIAGPGPNGHDQIQVTGTVTIDPAAIANFIGGYVASATDELILIANDGVDPIVGTYSGYAEGATVTFGAFNGIISYVGGDGNDLVLLGCDPLALNIDGPLSVTLDATGNGTITYATISSSGADGCIDTEGIVGLSPIPVTCADVGIGTVLVTITALDIFGNTATAADIPVNVVDNEAPTIVNVQDITIVLDASGNYVINNFTEVRPLVTATDNCGVGTGNNDIRISGPGPGLAARTFDCSDVATSPHARNIRVIDVNGNITFSNGAMNVTVLDNTPPVITPTPFSVDLDPVLGTATVAYASLGSAADNCPITSQGIGPLYNPTITVGCDDANNSPITVTLFATDGTNISSETVLLTVVDTAAPVMDPGVDINVPNQTGVCGAVVNYTYAGADANCSPVTVVQTTPDPLVLASGDVFPVGVTNVVMTGTAVSGLTATAGFTVTVTDVQPPTALCQDITVQLDALGNYMMADNEIDNSSTDNCGIVSYAASQTLFTCADVGTSPNVVTLIVTDAEGNTDTCTANVTVEDNVPPTLVCNNVTVQLDASGNASIVPNDIILSSGPVVYSVDQTGVFNRIDISATGTPVVLGDDEGTGAIGIGFPFNFFENTYTDLYISSNGYVSFSSVDLTDFSNDPIPNTVNPNDIIAVVWDDLNPALGGTIRYDAIGTAPNRIFVVDFDNIQRFGGGNAVTTQLQLYEGTYRIEVHTTSILGTVSGTQGVENSTGTAGFSTPLRNANDWTATNDIVAFIPGISSDACGIASASLDITNFDCSNLGPNTVTATVTDTNGNVSTCTATVTVEDNIAPTVQCLGGGVTATETISPSLPIPDNDLVGGVSSILNITDNFILADLDVNLDISHTWVGDLTITLESPQGTIATILERPGLGTPTGCCGCPENNILTTLDDEGISPVEDECSSGPAPAIGAGPFTPNNPLSVFDGESTLGNWILTVYDGAGGDLGTLNSWGITYSSIPSFGLDVVLDASGNASITAADINDGSSDACGIASMSVSPNTFTCADVGAPVLVTLTVTDTSGNTSTCTSNVNVIDNVAPVLDPVADNAFTAVLDGTGQYTVTYGDVTDNDATDACGIASEGTIDQLGPLGVYTPIQVVCSDALETTIFIRAIDVNGNVSEASVIINVEDPTPPTIQPLPGDRIDEIIDLATCSSEVNYTFSPGDGNCPFATIEQILPDPLSGLVSGAQFPIGVTNVTMRATSVGGATTDYSFVVEVHDDLAPTAVCNDLTVVLDGSGDASVTAAQVGAGSDDNCLPIIMTLDDYDFDCNDVGFPVTVTLTVTEDFSSLPGFGTAGFTAVPKVTTCTAVVTVLDDEFPVLYPEASFDLDLDIINGDGTITYDDLTTQGATDNCGIAQEGIGPTYEASMPVDCATSNGGLPFDVTIYALDNSGNISLTIVSVTVTDTSIPVFDPSASDPIVEPNDAGVCGAVVNYTITAADVNCAPVAVTQLSPASPVDGDVFPIGTTSIVMLATSTSGSTSTVGFDITIEDVELPTAVCQDITVQLNASGVATITPSDVDGGSFDNCAFGLSLDNDTFGCADVGDNTVTLTITDASGNPASCTATVTVEDNVAPVALCAPYTLVLDANGDGSIVPGDVDGGSSDACGIATMSVSPNTFDCTNVGVPNLVTLTVTDVNGNVDTCTTIVTVEDNTAPTAVCKAITVQLDADGDVTITGADVNDGSADACGVDTLSVSPSSFDCDDVGDNTVTLTVTDVNGNSSTCNAVVTVEDSVAPMAVCNDFDVILDAVGNASITVAEVDGGSSDACGIASMAIDVTDFTCADIGPNDVVLTVTDVNGNTSTCTAVVTVVDNIPALIACPADVVDDSDPGVCGAEVVFADASAIDVCGVVSIVQTAGLPSGSVFPIGVSTVEFTATDAGGNESVCSFTITIVDDEAPMASCVEELTVTLDEFGVASITTADIDDNSTDNCPIDFMTLSQSTFGCDDVGENTITLTVFDLSGNSSTCTTTVTVVDDIAPEIVCIGAPGDFVGMASDSPAMDIPDNDDAGMTTTITVTDEFDITDLDVMVDISHTWVGDVTVKLTSPSGTEVTLIDQMGVPASGFGCSGNDIDVTLDDEATDPIEDECGDSPAAGGSFTPNNALSAFDGETTMGDWTLFVSDSVGGDTGTLNSWGIAYSYSLETTPPYEVVLDEDGTVTFDASELLISVNEACGYEVTGADGETTVTLDCESLGLTEVEVTVTDASGNASSCVATVLVLDLTDPVITCVAAGETVPTETGSASDSPALAIPDNDPAGATTTITVADDVSITDLNVDLDISHTWVGDVTVKLTSPEGTEVTLIDRMGVPASTFGCDGADLAVTLDDEATDPIEDACGSPTTGSFTPNDMLSAFDGEMAMGDWTLFVSDAAGGDTGTVNSWGITYTYDGEPIVTESYSIFLNEEGWVLVDPFDLIEDTNEACGIDVAAADRVYFTCDDLDAGVIFVTVFVSDLSGNLASCVAEVQVYDTLAPVLTCPEDQTVDPGQGNLFYEVPDYIATGEATAVDNCSDPAATTQDPAPGTLLPDGEYTVAFTATDDSGNSSACEFTLTVESIILTVGDLNIGSVVMYPNPASDYVMLSNPQSLVLESAAIYDLTGRLVSTVDLANMGTEIEIDVSKLASATYMVLIKGDNGQVTKSLIKD